MRLACLMALVVAALVLLAGCESDVVWSGEQESPCASDADCRAGYACLSWGTQSFCSVDCTSGGGCRYGGYRCDESIGVCVPRPNGLCQEEHERCGEGFDACCSGRVCTDIPGWGQVCAAEGCTRSNQCWSDCCLTVDDGSVCAPPSYCR